MSTTIGETIQQLHRSLRDYIEATYHISDPSLIAQRRDLLHEVGVIHQRPFLESTPRYKSGEKIGHLGLDAATTELLTALSIESKGLEKAVYDPPFEHQAIALKKTLLDGRSLVVTTGTGSGKTECFLLPILGKIAREAKKKGRSFGETPAVRAMILYPMNALVNDQLGRLRLLFGDQRTVGKFVEWCGRPIRFARYTSRALYPGVRSAEKDQDRLKPLGRYYVQNLIASEASTDEGEKAKKLVQALGKRGKWPAKPNLKEWYGRDGSRWQDPKTGNFKRCVTLPLDSELLTRHEAQEAPPDVLVTNYSMLEYMLMRPIERRIFDLTREWLERNPDERFLLVIDEAHLYRGAAGAEVALLIRRLRMRLGISPNRLQVICTSASFQDKKYAGEFGAQLTGKDPEEFDAVAGTLALREKAATGSPKDAAVLSALDLDAFYNSENDQGKLAALKPFLDYRSIVPGEVARSLYDALVEFSPLGLLVNQTMQGAQSLDTLDAAIFPGVDRKSSARALTSLLALSSLARRSAKEPPLLPCRIHSFYRGLAGLWTCMDPDCAQVQGEGPRGPGGRIYSQPRDACECGARVLELFTCRNCGAAYARAYSDNIQEPGFLWPEAGGAFRTLSGEFKELQPLDLLLEAPVTGDVEPADFDLVTGRLNPQRLGKRARQIYLIKDRSVPAKAGLEALNALPGQFRPCAVCGESASYGRSSVQDHQTKGDQPFLALIAKQIQVQPPNPEPATRLAPLRGRKVLIFSDSRQMAARLAPNLQTYSTQDALRPLILYGYRTLQRSATLSPLVSLDDIYLAILIASKTLGVRLRPELKVGESFHEERLVEDAVKKDVLRHDADLLRLFAKVRSATPPEALQYAMINCLTDGYYGLESLALASLAPTDQHLPVIAVLPDIPGIATTTEEKNALVRVWFRCWLRPGLSLSRMPKAWWNKEVQTHSGKFADVDRFLQQRPAKTAFERTWLPKLLATFCEQVVPQKYSLKGPELTLEIGGRWSYCQSCRSTQRPFPGRRKCSNCGRDSAVEIDPDRDPVFVARKGYYRVSSIEALNDQHAPISLIAAEHTAQLNAAQSDAVFSRAEEHELLFQDVDLGADDRGNERPAIDVLSCTTTMEVGIDIGSLSGVALRNMPPARANYQQRSGRAGRRGNAVATVTAFGSSDSHDEHYFTNPELMIRGEVSDPTLTLDNSEIIRRHVTAYLLQRYHQVRLPKIRPDQQPHLFAVLGTVQDFKISTNVLNRDDFANWLKSTEASLRGDVESWLPTELSSTERSNILETLIQGTLAPIDDAIRDEEQKVESGKPEVSSGAESGLEVPDEQGDDNSTNALQTENLLDRLLYKGVLPRYAFPTDVANFYIFDADRSTRFRPAFQFAPSQARSVALTQYAPGKEVWVANKKWTSGALYSPIKQDRFSAWQNRRVYFECSYCHFARTYNLTEADRGSSRDCEACGQPGTFGPGRYWVRPPGFAHPVTKSEGTSPDEQPGRSYATRAKLIAPTPSEEDKWVRLNDRLRVHYTRSHLLVTNAGPRSEGYTYCTKCGLIEPTAIVKSAVAAPHLKPYPGDREPNCPSDGVTRGLVLGTDFITDVLLISLKVERPVSLLPGLLATDVALRTLAEALASAACKSLEIDTAELQAEY
jgi:hypothetical protein